MAIILDGTTGITAPDITSAAGFDAADLTGTVASARLPAGSVLQVKSLTYTDTFATSASQTLRIPITNFFVDITPLAASSKILVIANIAVGFSNTPEWSWFVDRTISGATVQVGTAAYVGNRMNGYHGGPQDGGATGETTEVFSYAHTILDSPNTTSSIRYQVCMQDRWVNYTAKYINRSGGYNDNGYETTGSSSLTILEVAA